MFSQVQGFFFNEHLSPTTQKRIYLLSFFKFLDCSLYNFQNFFS